MTNYQSYLRRSQATCRAYNYGHVCDIVVAGSSRPARKLL